MDHKNLVVDKNKFLDYYDENCIKIFIKSYNNITTIYDFYDDRFFG